MRSRWFIALLVPCLVSGQVVVRKSASEANPGLFVAEVQGPAQVQQLLVRTLTLCDWFSMVSAPDAAVYLLRARHLPSPPQLEIEVSSGGKTVVSFRQTGSGPHSGWLVFRAVDTLIRQLFKVPGLCASRIAFASGNGHLKEVMTCNFDGSDCIQLTHNRTISTEPSWGPGAASLVYTVYGRSWTDVALIDMVRNRHRRLSQFPGLNAGADLSPDGRWAALCLSRDRQVELYVMRLADGSLRRLTNDTAVESSPAWAPDGSGLCYVSDRSGPPRLYLIPAAGGPARSLLSDPAESVSPDWSKTSNRICFATRMGGEYALATVDMDDPASGKKLLSLGSGDWEAPSWAPDGRHLVCTRRTGSRHELMMVDTWYGKARSITNAGEFTLPNWSDLF